MREILITFKQLDGVVDVDDLHVWTISSGVDAMSGHVDVRDHMLSKSSKLLSKINTVVAERYNIIHTTMQMELEHEISFRHTIK